MLRQIAKASKADDDFMWLDPIDVDDPEFWLLSNLERKVIEELDRLGDYFGPYRSYLQSFRGEPRYRIDRIDHQTLLSHLDGVKQEFVNCYAKLVEETGKTIVIVFDTVEVIRNLSVLYTLTEWMESLPATLFILCGRPMQEQAEVDPIRRELEGQSRLPVTSMPLGAFTREAAHEYLGLSKAGPALSDEEKAKLVLLTRGYPLWLALTITYLVELHVPWQVNQLSLAELEQNMRYGAKMTKEGSFWFEDYKKLLTTSFKITDFQNEAIKCLAVVRQNVSLEIWERLMADRASQYHVASLPDEWEKLRIIPWIRSRSNNRCITLHDAVAEELASSLIRTQDSNWEWRHGLWEQAAEIYSDLSEETAPGLAAEMTDEQSSLAAEVARLDDRRREVDEFRVTSLHYKLLSNSEEGVKQFLRLFEQAREEADPLLRERLAVEIQRFLPNSANPPQEDLVRLVATNFHHWLGGPGADYYKQIVKAVAQYQIDNEQPQAANATIADLPERTDDPALRLDLNILKANALMRIPGNSEAAEGYLSRALAEAEALTSGDASLLQAKAHKELGFYYRQLGKWRLAQASYARAFDLLSEKLAISHEDEYLKEMASIERNWAYVNGIAADFAEATNLIESAIATYHRFGMENQEAAAQSVKGEILRYASQVTLAWRTFAEAERTLIKQRNWAWLGIVFQEQAICLVQAHRKGIDIAPGRDATADAKRLIARALTICQIHNLRMYPSALNRAARIFGTDDVDAGLTYAEQGIRWGARLSDGWKWTACLVEYIDLCYRGWVSKNEEKYRQWIRDYAAQVDEATAGTDFVDLLGKWNLLQGRIKIQDWIASGQDVSSRDTEYLAGAMENYRLGFSLMAETFVGSSSADTIGIEFREFRELFRKLPDQMRAEWLTEFRREWRKSKASTVLLARLVELY